jgi:site-specific DNA recombinase
VGDISRPMKYFLYCRKSTEAEDRQVMSIDSQRAELERAFVGRDDIEIVDFYAESKSAKAPGRSLFGQMMRRVEAGEAQGIIAWAPDRLARNSIDGGQVVYLLDRGVLRDLKFATYTFENNSQGKFMLSIMFGYSKYYSDNLSEVVKRGNRAKRERGWRPGAAPTGYLNDTVTKTMVIDPVRFPLVQRLFQMVLDGTSAQQAARVARDVWGFRTLKTRKGGTLISMSTVHHILTNPFYAGVIVGDGKTYPGRHQPAVTLDEFEAVQRLLRRPVSERPKRHAFAYTGLIRCGGCGHGVTAEHKVNRQGHRYVYYHCSRPKFGPPCREPSIEVKALEAQIMEFLRRLKMDPAVEAHILRTIGQEERISAEEGERRMESLKASVDDLDRQTRELTALRLRGVLSDEEFLNERVRLDRERLGATERLRFANGGTGEIEPARAVLTFSKYAADCYASADISLKRDIVEILGSNPTLSGKKLSIRAAKPFRLMAEIWGCPSRLGHSDDIPPPLSPNSPYDELVEASREFAIAYPKRMKRLRSAVNRMTDKDARCCVMTRLKSPTSPTSICDVCTK